MTYIQPFTLLFLLAALVALLRIPSCKAKRFSLAAVLGLGLFAWPPFDWLLSRPLEWAYPVRPFHDTARIQAIVVLSSAVSPAQFERPYPLPDGATIGRCRYAAWIHRFKAVPVLASGGSGRSGIPYARSMRALLLESGVPAQMIWTEERSHSTHQNAVNSARILRDHGIRTIALVVEAQSMLRAAACFRKEGIDVLPAPNRFRYLSATPEDWIPGWLAIQHNEDTIHEMLGLVWYKLRGWV